MSVNNKVISYFIRHPEYFKKIIEASYPFSSKELKKYQGFLDWRRISNNTNIEWSAEVINEFSENLDWSHLTTNPGVFKDFSMVNQFAERIQWKQHPVASQATIASNTGLPWTMEFIEKYESKLVFEDLSENESLPWTEQLINKYIDRCRLRNNS